MLRPLPKPELLNAFAGLCLLFLAGCGYTDRLTASATGYARSCIDGVEYLQFTSGATVAYTADGQVKACK